MKNSRTLTVALVALVVFTGLGVAQEKGVEKSQPTGVEKKQPAIGEKETAKDKAAIYKHEITGKVTRFDTTAKTFTIMIQGKAITFSAAKLSKLPTVGKMIDITYTWNPGETPIATSTTESSSKVGTGEGEGQLRSKLHHCPGHVPPFSTLNLTHCE